MGKRIVVALGGNALGKNLPEQMAAVKKTATAIVDLIEEGNQVIGIKFPCLVTFTMPNFDPRFPTIKRKLAANKAEIPVLSDEDFPDIDTARIGLKGSPTHVKSTHVPEPKTGGVKIEEEDVEAGALKLFNMLSEAKVF